MNGSKLMDHTPRSGIKTIQKVIVQLIYNVREEMAQKHG